MRSLNRVSLMGHLAADVDFRQTKSGLNVANFPVATNYTSRDDNGNKQEGVDYHSIVAWRKLAEICHDYLAKGTAVYLDGKLVNRSFEDKEGNRHYRTEIVADDINILTWKKNKKGQDEVGISKISEDCEKEAESDAVEEEAAVA